MTFFSNTDTATLKEEGIDRNNFVSLIVNNAGNYTAAITRRIKNKRVKEFSSYEFFEKGEKHDTKEYVSKEDEIEWFYLKVVKEGEPSSFQDMEERFEEIRKRKAEKAKKHISQTTSYKPAISNSWGTTAGPANIISGKETVVQESLFDDMDDNLPFKHSGSEIPYGTVKFDKSTIKQLTLQLVTGSIITPNDSEIDIRKWATHMPAIYQERFGKGEEGMKLFELWADTYTEFLTWYSIDSKLEAQGIDEIEMCAICAHDVIEELTKLPENEYIKGYINALQKYLVL